MAQVLVEPQVSCCTHVLTVTQSLIATQSLTPVQLLPDWQSNLTWQVLLPVHEKFEEQVSVVEQPPGGGTSAGAGAARRTNPPMPTATTMRAIVPTNCRRVVDATTSGVDRWLSRLAVGSSSFGEEEAPRIGCSPSS
ncbi:MAG: hypothetical protein ACP5I8_13625 [Phycisphaerae bacterium]